MSTIKNLASFRPPRAIKRTNADGKITFLFFYENVKGPKLRKSVNVSLNESLEQSNIVSNSASIVSEIKNQIRDRESLLYSREMLDNKLARKNYHNREVDFVKLPIDVKQAVLKGKEYNISELDSVQEVWKKTSKAIRSWKDREDQAEREVKRNNIFSVLVVSLLGRELAQRNKGNTTDDNAVSYLR